MAEKKERIAGTVSGSSTTESDELVIDEGGVVVVEYVQTAGTATMPVEVSIDGGNTYVAATDDSGTAITASMATGFRHYRRSWVAQQGSRYKVNPSTASGATVNYKMSRVEVV